MSCPSCEACKVRDEKRKLTNFKSNLRTKYNLSYEEWQALVEKHGNKCAICGNFEVDGKRLSIDHCHTTKKVRGLLCTGCNGGLGLFKDNTKSLEAAIVYLKNSEVNQ